MIDGGYGTAIFAATVISSNKFQVYNRAINDGGNIEAINSNWYKAYVFTLGF